jgi:hypothetical protein
MTIARLTVIAALALSTATALSEPLPQPSQTIILWTAAHGD